MSALLARHGEAARKVIVYLPAAVGYLVVKLSARLDVVLRQNVVADIPAALSLSGQEAEEVKLPVIRPVVAAVLYMIPDSEGDLQQLVHEDMKAHFDAYPKNWGLKTTDRNIDHRRVPNLQCFFKRKGWALSVTKKASDYQPGDFVTCLVAGRLPHIMVVSDRKATDGTPLVIHNIGSGTQEENSLFVYPLTGHFRIK